MRHLRLVEKLELAQLERTAKRRAEDHALGRRRSLDLRGEREVVAAGFLCAVHRGICGLEQRRRVLAVIRKHRDPDARAQPALLSVKHDRLGQRLQQAPSELVNVDLVGDFLGEHDELVAAQARHGIGVADRFREPARERLQDFVAGGVAERVIDVLEPVEIHEQERDGAIVASRERDRMVEPLEERGPVVQARQRIEPRKPADVGLDELLLRDVEPDAAIADERAVGRMHRLAADRYEAEATLRVRGAQDHVAKYLVGPERATIRTPSPCERRDLPASARASGRDVSRWWLQWDRRGCR